MTLRTLVLALVAALALALGGPATASSAAVAAPALTSFGTFVSDDGRTVVRLDRDTATHLEIGDDLTSAYRTNWGIITGTVYFNKRETSLAASASTLSAFAAFLPPPFNVIVGLNLARIAATAAIARYQGRCLQIKTNAYVGTYSGSWCSGSY